MENLLRDRTLAIFGHPHLLTDCPPFVQFPKDKVLKVMSSLTSKHFLISAWIASLCLWPFTGKYIVHVVTWTNGQRRCFNRSSYNWSEFSRKACSAWCCPQFMPLRKRWCFLLSREGRSTLARRRKAKCQEGKTLALPSTSNGFSPSEEKQSSFLGKTSAMQNGNMNTNYSNIRFWRDY